MLTQITHPDGTTVSYSYDTDGRLISAQDDESHYAVSYTYDAQSSRISGFAETANGTGGAAVCVEEDRPGLRSYRSCGPDMTLNTADDLLNTYIFDYMGRSINSYTTDIGQSSFYGAAAAKYTSNSGNIRNRVLSDAATGVQSPNMVADPGAESVTAIGASTEPWFVQGTASVETSTRHTGGKALKLSGNGSIQQTVTGLKANGWYVLSAYAYTGGVINFGTAGGVYMASGSASGEAIRWNTADVGDGWERIYVAAQADANGSITLAATASGIQGSVIFDDFQVEETPFGALGAPSAVSLLENGAMEKSTAWPVLSGSYDYETGGGLFGSSMRVHGTIPDCFEVTQTIQINQPGTQTYLLSGWAKGNSVPLSPPTELQERYFSMAAYVYYAGSSTPEVHQIDFCTETQEWQYKVFPIVPEQPEQTVSSIKVVLALGRNPNTVDFDNIALTREAAQSYKYDNNGNLISVSVPDNATPAYTYSGADLITQVTRGSGTYNYTYDTRHHMTKVTNNGLSLSATYDARGNTTGTTLTGTGTNLKITSSATYDTAGNRLLTQTDARGNIVSYQYEDTLSQMMGAPTKVTDPLGTVSSTTYNAANGRVSATSVLSGTNTLASLGYTYLNGQLSAMTRTAKLSDGTPFTQTYGMSYNAFGQTTGITVGNIALASYTYASNGGALQSMSYGNGDSVSYGYDALERVQHVYYNGSTSPALTYSYTASGVLGSLTDQENTRRCVYSYDGLDRLLSFSETYDGDGVQTLRTNYDTANRVSSYTYAVSPGWDGDFRDPRSYAYTYNSANGSLSGMTLPGGGAYSYTYDGLRRLTSRVLTRNSSTFLTREYSYLSGAGSNGTTTLVSGLETKKANGSTLRAWTYTYDAAGRIKPTIYHRTPTGGTRLARGGFL